MPRFRFVAMDSKGGESEGVLDAADQSEAVSLIRAKGLFPTSVNALSGGGGPAAAKPGLQATKTKKSAAKGLKMELTLPAFLGGGVKLKELTVFTRQLATLVEAGLPLLRSLRILLQQEKCLGLRTALSGMGESVEGGNTFSESLGMYPKIFDNLFVNMVKAGEAGGVLDVVLNRLSEFMEKAERIRRKIKGAMVYPVVVLVVAMLILCFLLVKIIPQFAIIFDDMLDGAQLPGLTQFVIDASHILVHYWYHVIMVVAAVVAGLKLTNRTKKGHFFLDMVKIKSPLVGPLIMKTAVARFSRTLGTLMTSGVPVLQALNIVRDTSGNAVIAAATQEIHDAVKEGDSMCMPMEASGAFPSMVVSMVDVGEETGALPDMLLRIADNYEDEVDTAVEALTSIIEPIMIVMLALIVGTIVIAMFVPLISIITEMS
ncbi:MAG: type II secretion system F family protein [Kiritimatiellae bacterium]|nr:type II secretion system F family protein [Kiritimatiellia bacterium]